MATNFDFWEYTVKFTDEQEEYNHIRLWFKEVTNFVGNDFEVWYDKCGSLDTLVNEGADVGYETINSVVKSAVDYLVEHDIYSFTPEKIERKYGEYYLKYWVEAFEEVKDQYMEIVLRSEELDAYRTARRQNRGRFVGGGFGVSGAMQGMATAGALNMAAGAVHGAVNIVGKIGTSIGNGFKKSKIYNSPDTKKKLSDGLCQACWNVHIVICNIMNIDTMPIDSDESEAIILNLAHMPQAERDHLSVIQVHKLLAKALYLNPYDKRAYKMLMFGFTFPVIDDAGNIQKFAEYFGMGDYLLSQKIERIEAVSKGKTYETSYEVYVAIKVMNTMKEQLSIPKDNCLPEEKRLNELYTKLDLQERTYEGVLFETQEEAEQAKAKKQEALKLYATLDNCTYEDAVFLKEQMDEFFDEKERPVFASEFNKIDEKIHQLDIERRTYHSILFDNVEEKEKGIRDLESINKILEESIWEDINLLYEKRTQIDSMNIHSQIKKEALEKIDDGIHFLTVKSQAASLDDMFRDSNVLDFSLKNIESLKSSFEIANKKYSADAIKKSQYATAVKNHIEKYDQLLDISIKYENLEFDEKREKRKLRKSKAWRILCAIWAFILGVGVLGAIGFVGAVIAVFILHNDYKKKLYIPYEEKVNILEHGKAAYDYLQRNKPENRKDETENIAVNSSEFKNDEDFKKNIVTLCKMLSLISARKMENSNIN